MMMMRPHRRGIGFLVDGYYENCDRSQLARNGRYSPFMSTVCFYRTGRHLSHAHTPTQRPALSRVARAGAVRPQRTLSLV